MEINLINKKTKRKCTSILVFSFYLLAASFLLASCDGTLYYSEYADIDEGGWDPADSACFSLDVDDTTSLFDLQVEVRNSVSYPYSNTFLFIHTTFPDGSIARDTMEFPLTDGAGFWLGKSTGRYVDTRYRLRNSATRFPMKGIYHFAVTNGMRDSAISGIKHIGLRVEYSQSKK